MLLLILGIALVQSLAAASPVHKNYSGPPLYQCPTPTTCKCDESVHFYRCDVDTDCDRYYPNPQHNVGCCRVQCKKEKYCVRLEKYKPTTSQINPTCMHSGKKNIVFLVDGTANGNQDFQEVAQQFQEIKNFVNKVVRGLSCSSSRVAVMQFGGKNDATAEVTISDSSNPDLLTPWFRDLNFMKQRKGVERRTGEALAAASNKLYEMEMLYDYTKGTSAAPGVVVIITHGKARDPEQLREEMLIMKLKKVHVVALSVGPHADSLVNNLEELLCSSSDVLTATYKGLTKKVDDILGRICSDFGRICAGDFPRLNCGNRKYDLYFAIDGSASINYEVFEKKKKLVMDLLVLLKSAPSSNINVGVMQFSEKEKTTEILPLGKYSLPDVQAVVEQMKFHAGRRTMLGDALMRVGQVFNGAGGDRSDAKNKLILFSDGTSHDLAESKMEAENLKKQGIEVIIVSVRSSGTAMKEMASESKLWLNVKLTSLADSAEYADKIESLICRSD